MPRTFHIFLVILNVPLPMSMWHVCLCPCVPRAPCVPKPMCHVRVGVWLSVGSDPCAPHLSKSDPRFLSPRPKIPNNRQAQATSFVRRPLMAGRGEAGEARLPFLGRHYNTLPNQKLPIYICLCTNVSCLPYAWGVSWTD